MAELSDGESIEMAGSGAKPYVLKNVGGVYSCTCPAWRNQSSGIERRTCKHLRKLRGEAAEVARVGQPAVARSQPSTSESKAGPPILLAHSWDSTTDLKDWWMSEKLDGVRAYWDGKAFLSRQGNVYDAPDWFLEGLPPFALDGELWMDRKSFQQTVSVVRRKDKSEQWQRIRYLVFDAPQEGRRFEERKASLEDLLHESKQPFARIHSHRRCLGLDDLQKELRRVESLGGEGLMLREPGSYYEVGRSSTLLKVKTFHDAEAKVIGHSAGTGKFKGMLGSLVVVLDDGTEFSVGTGLSEQERAVPPPVGSTITFRYQELSDGGVPRFPSFVRVRAAAGLVSPTPKSEPSTKTTALSETERLNPSTSRYFEFEDGKSRKFWEVALGDSTVTVRYGRIGTEGQSKTKAFSSQDAAQSYHDKLVEEKSTKGYVERTTGC